jgi:uncharacterized protein YeaO (DUF488 family)
MNIAGVNVKRVRAPAEPTDGYRVLVDRLWPRGLAREQVALDEWARDLAPSDELRRWFGHDPERWEEFRHRYQEELEQHRDELSELRRRSRRGVVTLLYDARDEEHNNAQVLARAIRRGLPRGS